MLTSLTSTRQRNWGSRDVGSGVWPRWADGGGDAPRRAQSAARHAAAQLGV